MSLHPHVGLLQPTGANDVLSYALLLRDFFLSSTVALSVVRGFVANHYWVLPIGLLHPTGANDVLSYPTFVRQILSFFLLGVVVIRPFSGTSLMCNPYVWGHVPRCKCTARQPAQL